MRQAPEEPTRQELQALYPITEAVEVAVLNQCAAISEILNNHDESLVAIIGGCAMTDNTAEILSEGGQINALQEDNDGLVTVHRIPVWKPRTNPDDWHGLETGLIRLNEDGIYEEVPGLSAQGANVAYSTLVAEATQNGSPGIEIASKEHIDRYGRLLAFEWIGSRNEKNSQHIKNLAIRDPRTPMGVKNCMDGDISNALIQVESVNEVRKTVPNSAPAVLIYRGGENAKTPEEWEREYVAALKATEGKMIVDVAHGSEIAHDTNNGKSVDGQILALQAVLNLAEKGHAPAGIMIEASDIQSPTDPVMPLQVALDGAKRLLEIKQRSRVAIAV